MERRESGIADATAPTQPMGLPLSAIAPPTRPMGLPMPLAISPPPPDSPPAPTAPAAFRGTESAPRQQAPRQQAARRRRPVALVAAASLLGAGGAALATDTGRLGRLIGPQASSGPAASAVQARRAAITSLVARLDAALAAGDEATLAGAVDPRATALVTRWRTLPARARAVGATGLGLDLAAGALSDLPAASAVPAGVTRAGYAETVQVPVSLGYTLTPWDRGPVRTVLALRFGRQGETWRVLDDDGPVTATTVPAADPLEPWVRGPVGMAARGHVLVVGDVSQRTDNERVASSLEKAVTSVRSIVPTQRWNGRVVAYASTDATIVASWFGDHAATESHQAGNDPAAFAAEVRTLPGRGLGGSAPMAARLAITPFLLQRTDARAQAVLRHEVTHVALALEGSGDVPAWLVEGTAEYTAYRVLRGGAVSGVTAMDRRGLPGPTWQHLRKGTWKPSLISDVAVFYGGSSAEVARAYTDSWLTCLYIAAHYGEESLFRLYSAAASTAPGQDPDVTEVAVLRSVLKTDRATLARGVSGYARTLRTNFT